jgi:hypothetical protein
MWGKAMEGKGQCRVNGVLYNVSFRYASIVDMRSAAIVADMVKFAAALRRKDLNSIPSSVVSFGEVNDDPR